LDVAGAIESLNSDGNNISLHIQTPTIDHKIFDSLKNFKCVVINPTAEYTQIPAIFSDADILLLANDFDEKAVTFLKYSMPTKASEYMISGTPILVYSAENTAVTKFFKENNCGHCVTINSRDEIRNAILTLINNQDYRQQLSMNAVNLAKEKFDDEKVRSEFRRALLKAIAIQA
jgi:glycosyltransferase involved in cell wall biosynthesis